jgi:tetratricopeptide (TPR) repeat protein
MSSSERIRCVILCNTLDETVQTLEVLRKSQIQVQECFFQNIVYYNAVIRDRGKNLLSVDIYNAVTRGGSVMDSHIIIQVLEEPKPHWIFFIGACAGNPEKVKLGDVLVANRVFGRHIHETVKSMENPALEHAIYDTAEFLCKEHLWERLISVTRPASSKYKRDFLRKILYNFRSHLELDKSVSEDVYSLSLTQIQQQIGGGPIAWHPEEYTSLLIKLSQEPKPQISYSAPLSKYYLNDTQYEEIKYVIASGEFPEPDPLQPTVHVGSITIDAETRTESCDPSTPEEKKYDHNRVILGSELEFHSIYKALDIYDETLERKDRPDARFIIVKGVCDLGDLVKDGQYHRYAKQVSAAFVYQFIVMHGYEMADKRHNRYFEVTDKSLERPESKAHSNLTTIVDHFKRKRLVELKNLMQPFTVSKSKNLLQCVIVGVGGCGKTELAKAYALEYGSTSSEVFGWRFYPDATSDLDQGISYQQTYSSLLENFNMTFAKAFHDEELEHMYQRLNCMVWQKISRYPKWIVIFDSAESYTDIEKYLPPDSSIHGIIMITTRRSDFVMNDETINFRLGGLDETEAVELLKEISDRDKESDTHSLNLVRILNCHPLAIRTAGYYLRHVRRTTFEQYNLLLHEHCDTNTDNAMSSMILSDLVLNLLLDEIRKSDVSLFRLLQSCAFINDEDIPVQLLSRLYADSVKDDTDKSLTSRLWRQICNKNVQKLSNEFNIRVRTDYSSLTYDPLYQSFKIHRDTQSAIRNCVAVNYQVGLIRRLVGTTIEMYPFNPYSVEQLRLCHKMEPHFVALMKRIQSNQNAQALRTEHLQLLLILGEITFTFSQYVRASEYLESALQIAESESSSNLELRVEILRHLGNTNYILGGRTESLGYLHRSLRCGYSTYKSIDWRLARIHNDLGYIYVGLNLFDEALESLEKAAKSLQETNSDSRERNLERARLCHCKAQCYQERKDLEAARVSWEQALNLMRSEVNDTHPYVAGIYLSLAGLGVSADQNHFVDVGIDYPSAKEYVNKSLSSYLMIYGLYSSQMSSAYYLLGRLLYLSKNHSDWDLALKALQQSIRIEAEIMGLNSSKLMQSYYWKAEVLGTLSRYNEAQKAYHDSLILAKNDNKETYWIRKIHHGLRKVEENSNQLTTEKEIQDN